MRTTYVANLALDPRIDEPYEQAEKLALAWGDHVLFRGQDGKSLTEGAFDDGAGVRGSIDEWAEGHRRMTRLRLAHPDRDDSEILRTSTVWIIERGEATFVRIRLGVTGTADHLPGRVSIAPPRLIRSLLDLGVVADGRQLSASPTELDSTGVHQDFLPLITDQGRSLPVVLLTTPYSDALFPTKVARRLAGLAHVITPASVPTTFTITEVLGREWTAFRGAVRIYWPGLDLDGDPREHSLFLFKDHIRADGLERLHATITARYSGVWSVPEEDQLLDVARARSLSDDDDWLKQLENEIDARAKAEKQVELAHTRIEELEEKLRDAQQDLELARRQIGMVRAATDVGTEESPDATNIDLTYEPRTVADAVLQAQREARALVFLDDAIRSSEKSHFPKPEKVLDDLRRLDEAAQAWTGEGIGWKELLASQGLTLDAGVSTTALGQYPEDYRRQYEGETVELGPHIRHGTKPRSGIGIYWWVDEENRKLVIGHIGDKLRDTTNRT